MGDDSSIIFLFQKKEEILWHKRLLDVQLINNNWRSTNEVDPGFTQEYFLESSVLIKKDSRSDLAILFL